MSDQNTKSSELKKLQELAKGHVEDDHFAELSEIDRFILDKQLEVGEIEIDYRIIYYEYMKWCNLKPNKTSQMFFTEFNRKFKRIIVCSENKGNWYFYALNPSSFDLTPEAMQHAKNEHRNQKYKDKEKIKRRKKTQSELKKK